MRNKSTQMVFDLVKLDKRVLAVTADNRNEIYNEIRMTCPSQYIEYGIAEENMVASCAGLASCGYIPFLYTITNFMSMHAFEFIRNDVCIGNRNVKFLGRSAALVSSSMGATHQGTEELGLLRALPNLVVITPATPIEAREATRFAYHHNGPVYIRLEGFHELELYDDGYGYVLGESRVVREGSDISVFTMGSVIHEALIAASRLKKEKGLELEVINVPTIKPLCEQNILDSIRKTGRVVTLEEHSVYGGLGSVIAEIIAKNKLAVDFHMMGLDGCAQGCGNRGEIRQINHLTEKDLMEECIKMIGFEERML